MRSTMIPSLRHYRLAVSQFERDMREEYGPTWESIMPSKQRQTYFSLKRAELFKRRSLDRHYAAARLLDAA